MSSGSVNKRYTLRPLASRMPASAVQSAVRALASKQPVRPTWLEEDYMDGDYQDNTYVQYEIKDVNLVKSKLDAFKDKGGHGFGYHDWHYKSYADLIISGEPKHLNVNAAWLILSLIMRARLCQSLTTISLLESFLEEKDIPSLLYIREDGEIYTPVTEREDSKLIYVGKIPLFPKVLNLIYKMQERMNNGEIRNKSTNKNLQYISPYERRLNAKNELEYILDISKVVKYIRFMSDFNCGSKAANEPAPFPHLTASERRIAENNPKGPFYSTHIPPIKGGRRKSAGRRRRSSSRKH